LDEEEQTLQAHARSGAPRDILTTFYTYEQVKYSFFLRKNNIHFCYVSIQLG